MNKISLNTFGFKNRKSVQKIETSCYIIIKMEKDIVKYVWFLILSVTQSCLSCKLPTSSPNVVMSDGNYLIVTYLRDSVTQGV